MKKESAYYFIIGILCFLIASSICVQYRSVHTYTTEGKATVQSMSENKLRDRVLTEQENYNRLYATLQNTQAELEELRKNSSANSEEAKNLEKELSELNRVLGYTEVKGKGIIITLRDATEEQINDANDNVVHDSVVHDWDVLSIVNELFNAGAEAVSVNNQRIISTTAINCAGTVITINNQKVSVPFVIKAIGPDGMYDTVARPYGYYDNYLDGRVDAKIEKIDKENGITVPKYAGTRQYKYLQVVE